MLFGDWCQINEIMLALNQSAEYGLLSCRTKRSPHQNNMKRQHPILPLALESMYYRGDVHLTISGQSAGHTTDEEPGDPTPSDIANLKKAGKNPHEYRTIAKACLSPNALSWVLENRPALLAVAKEGKAQKDAEAKARRDAEIARDAPLLAEMDAEVKRLQATIPSDHVEVRVIDKGDFDGYRMEDFECGGVKLRWDQVTSIGHASAIRPGAMGAFAHRRVCSISRADLEASRSAAAKNAAKAAEQKAAREAVLNAPVPEAAVAAYKSCGGDPELLHDDIDHPHYWLVKRYADAIEHQGLASGATLQKTAAQIKEAAREEMAQYGGGEA
jgi:hypothetical protein